MQRVRVRERRGLEALAGTWTGPAHWGPPAVLEIRPDGGATLEDEDFRIEVQGERLDLVGGEARQKRLYRATERRLTLRCQPAASGYPERIADPDNPMQTLVFARARGGS